MLFICKSCKKIVDTNKHDFCPKCGANFNYSEGLDGGTRTEDYAEYERNREHEEEMRRAEQQNRRIEEQNKQAEQQYQNISQPHNHNHGATLRAQQYETKRRMRAQANKQEGKKSGCIGCFSVIFIIAMAILDIFSVDFGDLADKFTGNSEYNDTYTQIGAYVDDYIDEETGDFFNEVTTAYTDSTPDEVIGDGMITLGLNEFVAMERYIFGCDEVREGHVSLFEPDEGYMFVAFHFQIDSIHSDTMYFYGYPTLYADGIEMEFVALAEEPLFMAGEMAPYTTYDGYMTYQVPVDTKVFEIVYNNEIKIVINNHLSMQ